MNKKNMKWLTNTVIVIAAAIFTQTANAGTSNPVADKAKTPFELKQVSKDKIMISCNLQAADKEYYEIERSSDNVSFKTVGIVFPASAAEQMRNGISLKDNVSEQKTVYYRLKKITGELVSYTETKTITLQ
jgi:hypothetical protein